MKIFFVSVALVLGSLGACSQQIEEPSISPSGASQQLDPLDIAYDKFTLENGLRVIVLPDDKLPIASISILYDVGSKDEVPGKTGLAHLFEHMMFEGSENNKGQFFSQLSELGATQVNGLTSKDYTIYKETFPIGALERILWLESDRMGHLLEALSQEKLDIAKGAVLSEAAGRLESPFGDWEAYQLAGVFTTSHPYGHTAMGSIEDVKNATLEDAHAWFQQYYGANNAVLVLAGDVTAEGARELVSKYFADVAPGPITNRAVSNIPVKQSTVEDVLLAKQNSTTIVRIWAVPGYAEKEFIELQLAAELLQKRLDSSLVQDLHVASNARVVIIPQRLSSQFKINVVLSENSQLEQVTQILNEEISNFLTEDVDNKALASIIGTQISATVSNTESLTALSLLVAEGELAKSDPLHFKKSVKWTSNAQGQNISSVARKWLASGYYQMTIKPRGSLRFAPASVDRSALPTVGVTTKIKFPQTKSRTFSNGTKIYVTKYGHGQISHIKVLLNFNTFGKTLNEKAKLTVIAKAIVKTANANLLTIGEEAIAVRSGVSENWISVSASTPNSRLGVTATQLFKAIENPQFTEDILSVIADSVSKPVTFTAHQQADLIMSATMVGSTYDDLQAKELAAISGGQIPSVEDIKNFYHANIGPSDVTVLAVGNLSINEIMPTLESGYGSWPVKTNANLPENSDDIQLNFDPKETLQQQFQPKIYIINQPKQKRATIKLGLKISGKEWRRELDVLNHIYGNMKNGRLQTNLRWKRSWTYVATSGVKELDGVRYLSANTTVENNNVATSMTEMRRELLDLSGENPASTADIKAFQNTQIMRTAKFLESSAYLISTMALGLQNDDDFRSLVTKANSYADMSVEMLEQAARALIHNDNTMWIIIGDAEILAPDLKQLGYGEVIIVEAQ